MSMEFKLNGIFVVKKHNWEKERMDICIHTEKIKIDKIDLN